MFNAFKNMLNMGGGNEKKPSVAGQNQKTSDDNVRYEVISFEIQESDNFPRARMFTGKPDEEEYESQVPAELIRKRTLSTKNVSEEEDKKSKKVVLEDLQKYIYYTTTNQDTLIGLSIKFNISEAKIKLINDVSDTIFPGMKLKFPKDQCKPAAPAGGEENDGIPSDYQAIHRKALSLKKEQNSQIQRALAEVQEVHRYHFYYCTPYGNIMGCLSINEGVIMFDPSLSNVTNMQKLQSKLLFSMFLSISIAICVQEKRVIKFQACIDIKDINEALALVLPPRASEMVSEDTKEYVLQISLSHIGNKDIYKKYKDRLKQLKKEKKSISTVFFRVFEKDALGADLTNADKQKIVQNVVAIINKNVEQYNMGNLDNPTDKVDLTEAKNLGFEIVGKEDLKKLSDTSESTKSDKKEGQGNNGSTTKESESNPTGEKEPVKEEDDDDEEEQESLTILPFFDILYENIVQKKKQAQSNIENEQSELAEWLQSEFAPKMNETQTVLTQELFLQIIFYVPSMFRFTNWKIIYSNLQHGMSFQTLLRNCEEDSPVFVVIQTFQNERFGAYLSDAIHSGFHFYGTGECFLFKFLGEEQNKIKIFRATGKNEHFIFSNPDGMGIGCGEKYGLYINSDLYKGETNKCDTFDNDLLTSDQEKPAFKIKTIEIWGLDM